MATINKLIIIVINESLLVKENFLSVTKICHTTDTIGIQGWFYFVRLSCSYLDQLKDDPNIILNQNERYYRQLI